ncbi:protein PAT1 homolog 2 isoform X2 [Elgaria multicarinata webbii]|uniref:protein PAT1 homolog 2 isoform X2 n=1 Tax=Elgaria multicarinata webbii TaxID=159646 RepID=UPI002FCD4610
MAEGGEAAAAATAEEDVILEDYFMMDEEPLDDKTAEEDEIDLYINLSFTSAAYLEENEVKTLVTDPEEVPTGELEASVVAAAEQEEKSKAVEEEQSKVAEVEPMLEDVSDNESLHAELQLAYDAMEEEEEEVAMTEQEEDHTSEAVEEPNVLGDPAVMRAVRGQPTLEREDSAVLDSRVANSLTDYPTDYSTASKSGMWKSTLRRVPSLSMMEALERASMSRVDLDFLTSPVRTSYLDSLALDRPAFRGRTIKPSSQRFTRQSTMTPGSVRSPYPFTPPRRTRRMFGLNQTSSCASPPPFRSMFSNVNSPTWPLTHALDSPPFSPSTNSQQKFSLPSAMTQLHPLHQRILKQRRPGQERRIRCMVPLPLELDPYAALMTLVEKDWVIKVQMLQLQSENPHQDDYYYQEYYRKLEHKQAEKGLLGGSKPEVPKLVTPYIQKVETYESVVRIPGSLGQVAVSTCHSPRRAIDAVHHISVEQVVGNQRLQILYQIEKMYLWLLDMEDTQRKLDLSSEEQHPHFCEKLAQEVECICHTLRIEEHNSEDRLCCFDTEMCLDQLVFSSREAKDEFLQILLVGKGKRLVARLLPHLSQDQAKQVLVTITQHLPLLIKKDMLDEMLPVLYNPLSDVIEQLTFGEMVDILQELTRLQPESVKQSLAMVFGNKFAISLLYLLLSHGERCLSSGLPLKPHNGGFEKWVDTVLLVARELSQVPKTSMVEPLHLPSNLLFLFCRYVDKDTVNHLDVKME